MSESHDDRVQAAFDELRATNSNRAPGFRTIRDQHSRPRRVRAKLWPIAASAILVAFLVARGTRPDALPSIAEWRAPSDDLIEATSPAINELSAGSSALNELLPAELQIGGGL